MNFDQGTDRRVNNYINNNEYRVTPFMHADFDRLDENNYLTKPVTIQRIKNIIKNFKNNKAPGASGINKVILLKLPDSALIRFADILNATISMGYFPVVLNINLKTGERWTLPNKLSTDNIVRATREDTREK